MGRHAAWVLGESSRVWCHCGRPGILIFSDGPGTWAFMSRPDLGSTGSRQVLGTTGHGPGILSLWGPIWNWDMLGAWFHGSLGSRVASLAGVWLLSGQLGSGPSLSLG